jgi:DNA-binding transcriptional ArsR family regulator
MNLQRSLTPYLRPLEAVPLGVSDVAVMERLKAVGSGVRGPSVEATRAASLVALVLGVASREQLGLHPGVDPWAVDCFLPPEQLAIRTGLAVNSVQEALRLLAGARVLDQVNGAFRFAEGVFSPVGEEGTLHWPTIVAALSGDGTGILVCRAHALLAIGPRDGWSAVPTRPVGEQTGYGSDTIRRARRRLMEAGMVEERRLDGASSQYRFAALAFGLVPAEPPASPVTSRAESPLRSAAVPPPLAPSPPPAPAAETGFRLMLGGGSLEVPAGARVSVVLDETGRPVIQLELA